MKRQNRAAAGDGHRSVEELRRGQASQKIAKILNYGGIPRSFLKAVGFEKYSRISEAQALAAVAAEHGMSRTKPQLEANSG
ncbi:MAG: hypothetical protein ACXW1F_07800 [Halobacteriota archaeon]